MSELIRSSQIDSAWLKEEDYLRTLLGAASACGLIDQHDMVRIADQFLLLLAAEASAFTQGTSTSLPGEQVDMLHASVCYTVGLALMPMSPDEAVEQLKREPLKAIFLAGRGILDRKIRAAMRFVPILRRTLLAVDHAAYQFAVQHAHRAFFHSYDSRHAAHALDWIPAYLPCLPLTRAGGILYLQDYLGALHTENLICRGVPAEWFTRAAERVEDHNLCALLLDSMHERYDTDTILARLGLKGRAETYARRYLTQFSPKGVDTPRGL
ncbi:MAG: hypothetical protein IJF49_07335 [Clostridia bacterium]|nr:hypothetical protein [Clostridia bacterium]